MPEGDQFLQFTGGQPSPFSGGAYTYRNAFDLSGLPGMQGGTGMMAGMLLQSFLPSILGPNYLPTQLMPTGQNLQQHFQTMQYYQQRQQAMQIGSEQDEDFYFRTIRGISNMAGVRFGRQQEEAARRVAKDFATMSPMVAQVMPEFWDQLHGMRGSSAVMTMGVQEAGRMMFDPVTGRMGLSGESAGELSRRMTEQLYRGPIDQVMREMHGLRAGQAGMAFEEMARRGLMPEQLTPEQIKDRMAQDRVTRGESRDLDEARRAIEQLGRDRPAQLESAMRGYSTDRAARQLKEYSGAIKAVQEIFGDMGHPDAPMSQIFNALQTMTQGGVGRFSPEQLEQQVRRTYTIAKMTRLGIDQMQALQGELSDAAVGMGLDRSFAEPAAEQAALAAHAYGASGAEAAGGWRTLSKEEYLRLSGRLSVQASASDQAVQLGAVAMVADQMGFRGKGAAEANALAAAVREGRDTYTFVDPATKRSVTRSVFMSTNEYTRIMRAGGTNQSVIDELRSSPEAVQETVRKYDIGNLIRANQGKLDIDPLIDRLYQGAAFTALIGGGMDRDKAGALAGDIGGAAVKALRGMNKVDRADPIKRNAAFVKSIRNQFKGDPRIAALSDEQLTEMSMMGFADTEEFVHMPGSGLAGFKGTIGLLDLTDPEIARKARATSMEIQGITEMQSTLAGLGQMAPVTRIMEAIASAKPGDDMQDFIAQAIGGGINRGRVTERIEARIRRLEKIGSRMKDAKGAGNQAVVRTLQDEARRIVGDLNRDFEHVERRPGDRRRDKPSSETETEAGEISGGAEDADRVTHPRMEPTSSGFEGGTGGPGVPTGSRKPSIGHPDVARADRKEPEAGRKPDAHPRGRDKIDIAGTLNIKWPNIGELLGHGSDPRSASA
jgi:hypothetical protein